VSQSPELRNYSNAEALSSRLRKPTNKQEVPEVEFDQISGGSDMVVVRFGKIRYELKRTRSGRLVMHK